MLTGMWVLAKLAAARWAIFTFERQDHLVGTVTGSPSGRPSQGSGLPILTAPHDELAALHLLRSFDHLVGACEQLDRRIEAKRLGGLQIDHQLELCRKLDRQVTGLFALENAIDVGCCASEEVGAIDSIRRQPAVLDHFAERIDHRQAIAGRELEEERLMS